MQGRGRIGRRLDRLLGDVERLVLVILRDRDDRLQRQGVGVVGARRGRARCRRAASSTRPTASSSEAR